IDGDSQGDREPRFANKTQSNLRECLFVWRRFGAADITAEKLAHVCGGNLRNHLREIFRPVTAPAKIVSRIRTLQVKLFIHTAHDFVERSFTMRLATNQQIEDKSKHFAFRVVTN